jgi:hypothetical protein
MRPITAALVCRKDLEEAELIASRFHTRDPNLLPYTQSRVHRCIGAFEFRPMSCSSVAVGSVDRQIRPRWSTSLAREKDELRDDSEVSFDFA